jgi:hypothetical protein
MYGVALEGRRAIDCAVKEYAVQWIFAFPYAGINRIRFKGTISILYRIPPKPDQI